MTANGLSKRAAYGLAAVSWPIIFLVELMLAKKFAPNLFNFIGIGSAEAVEAASRKKELETYAVLGIMLLASFFLAALIARITQKNETNEQTTKPEKNGDA